MERNCICSTAGVAVVACFCCGNSHFAISQLKVANPMGLCWHSWQKE